MSVHPPIDPEEIDRIMAAQNAARAERCDAPDPSDAPGGDAR